MEDAIGQFEQYPEFIAAAQKLETRVTKAFAKGTVDQQMTRTAYVEQLVRSGLLASPGDLPGTTEGISELKIRIKKQLDLTGAIEQLIKKRSKAERVLDIVAEEWLLPRPSSHRKAGQIKLVEHYFEVLDQLSDDLKTNDKNNLAIVKTIVTDFYEYVAEDAVTWQQMGDFASYEVLEAGPHEARRQIRWFPMYFSAFNGIVRLNEELTGIAEFDQLLQDSKLAKSRYVREDLSLHPADPVASIPRVYYYVFAKVIKDIGKIKDRAQEAVFLKMALAQARGISEEKAGVTVDLLHGTLGWDPIHQNRYSSLVKQVLDDDDLLGKQDNVLRLACQQLADQTGMELDFFEI